MKPIFLSVYGNPKWLLMFVISAILIALCGYGDDAVRLLRYENTIGSSREWWRLLSGHFVHLGWMHLILNLIGLWIILLIYGQYLRSPHLMISILLIAFGISLGLLTFSPKVGWYIGFSGVLHGLIILLALENYQKEKKLNIAVLILVTAKLLWEQLFGIAESMENIIGGRVVFDSHLYGAIMGVIMYFVFFSRNIILEKILNN